MTAFAARDGVEATFTDRPPLAVLDLSGDLSSFDEPRLRAAFAQAAASGTKHVLLNFSQVAYVNSSGIGVLIDFLRDSQENGRHLLFCGLDPHYRKIFHIMGLTQYATVVDDEAAALASVNDIGKQTS